MRLNLGKLIWLRPLDSALVITKDAEKIKIYIPNEPDDDVANESAVVITALAVALITDRLEAEEST